MKNDKPFAEQELEKERKTLRVEKETPANYPRNAIKRVSLTALALLLTSVVFMNGAHALEKLKNKKESQKSYQTYEQENFICNLEENYAKDPNITTITIGNYKVYVCDPVEKELDGQKTYEAPEGFTLYNDLCYRIHCHYSAPMGFIPGTDGKAYRQSDNEEFTIPEGFIPVGECGVSIIKAETYEIDGKTFYELPEGYILSGKYGYKVVNATVTKILGK